MVGRLAVGWRAIWFAGSSTGPDGQADPEGRRRASSPRSRNRTRSCCPASRIGRQHRICVHIAGMQSTQGDKHLPEPSSPSQKPGSPYCTLHSIPLSQTTSNSLFCRAVGFPLCTTSVQPPQAGSHNSHISSSLHASTSLGPLKETCRGFSFHSRRTPGARPPSRSPP